MKLDHLNGQIVDSVHVGDADWDWWIRFQSGATVRNMDARRTARPGDEIVGQGLLTIDEDDTGNSELVFGSVDYTTDPATQKRVGSVKITGTQYQIAVAGQPVVNSNTEYNPADDLPEDPSPQRVVEGPLLSAEALEAEDE